MAAPDPMDKVRDKEYSNWLKVTLALYYMKSGLHTFIMDEIDCLHLSLVQKIYGGPTVPLPPCTMCDASRVKRNKFTGVWAFQKRCSSYCDDWIYKLLRLHTNPKSEKIYWDNSDVRSWPFKSWECAKVFMPRGQLPSNAGPAECDAQALLTLVANCTHLHGKLSPQGLGLTHTISVLRNKVIHNAEMKVSDADRRSFIQQIIQLLEDPVSLMSVEDCKAAVDNIHKIDNDSVDVFFNVDHEMTALRAAVKDARQELGVHEKRTEDTVASLKEEYKELIKRSEDFENELKLYGTRIDTVESDVQQQKKKQEEMHKTVTHLSASLTSHEERLNTFEESVHSCGTQLQEFDTVKEQTHAALQQQQKISESIDTMSASVDTLQVRLDAVEENVQSFGTKLHEFETIKKQTHTALQQQEKLSESNKTMSSSITTHGVRLDGVEENVAKLQEEIGQRTGENIYCRKANSSKIRPESDGLRQLKGQTEDRLDTIRRLQRIPTRQAEEVKNLLEKKKYIVIRGNPGEGKTITAFHLIDNERYRDRRVVVYCPRDWKTVDTDWVDIVVLEDIFGQFDLDPFCLQEWMVYLPTIQEHVDAGKLQVIITTRIDILSKAYSKLGSLKLISGDLAITLSSENLEISEKMGILNRELQRHKRSMKEDEKEKCIANFSGLIGFPQCCSLFAGDGNLFERGPEFFKSPEKLFVENMTNLEKTRFLSLAFLFCNGEICEEYLSFETMPMNSKCLLIELASSLDISKKKATATLLRDSYDSFLGLYVVKSKSDEVPLLRRVKGHCFQFSHATVYEAVGQVLGDRCVEMVVKHCTPECLFQRTYTAETRDRTCQNVFIPVSVYGLIAERMVKDVVEKKLVKSVVKHSSLKQGQFLMKLKDELEKGNRIMDFFMDKTCFNQTYYYSYYKSMFIRQDLSEGECITFLQYILQNNEDVVTLVFSHFLEFLACKHNNKTSDCWQCEEKQKLLELAFFYHHFEIADKLINMNACYTHESLCNAARHGDLIRVQTILETLKRSQVFNSKCYEAKEALFRAFISGNQSLIELLLKEGIILYRLHVVDVVQQGDINALIKVVDHLKCHNNWNPHLEEHGTRIYFSHPHAYSRKIKLGPYDSQAIGKTPFSIALYISYCNGRLDMTDYLVKNGVKVSMYMLTYVLACACPSQQVAVKVIQHLKDTSTWDSSCGDASDALRTAYLAQKYDICHLLIRDGVLLTMKNLPDMLFWGSLVPITKAVQHLKDTGNWNPKCDDASKSLEEAYWRQKYDVCDMLIKEGVSLTMKNLHSITLNGFSSSESIIKTVQDLKDIGNWNPKCDHALQTLELAFLGQLYDVCGLLIEEGVSLTMNNFHDVVYRELKSIIKLIQHLKDTGNWNPKCDVASEALQEAYWGQKYDVCDLLIQEGVSPTMQNLSIMITLGSLKSITKTIQHLKDTGNWNPKCDHASEALHRAYHFGRYNVCDLLIEEGISPTMANLLDRIISGSLESVTKTIQHLKDTDNWNPKCDHASKALEIAYHSWNYHVYNLLIQEGVSLTMENFHNVIILGSLESVKKTIQHLKDSGNWNPKCKTASESLEVAYCLQKCNVYDLLIQEGVSLTLKNFPGTLFIGSVESAWNAIQHLKDTNQWDPFSEDAVNSLSFTKFWGYQDVCDLLMKEGVCEQEIDK